MFFKIASRLENELLAVPAVRLTAFSLAAAFGVVAAVSQAPEAIQNVVANLGGITAGTLVILRQAGMKDAEAMKKLNVSKSSAACVQYGIMGNWSGVFTNLTSIGINQLYLSMHGRQMPESFTLFQHKIKSSFAVAGGGAAISTSLSLPFIVHAFNQGYETSAVHGLVQGAIHTLPLAANYFGIAAAAQREGKFHRGLMGGAGGISIVYDISTGAYGMLVSSVGSLVGTGVGWYKHDRKRKNDLLPLQP
jgi:hypothetical protein